MKISTTQRGVFSRGATRFLLGLFVGLAFCGSTLWGGYQDATQSVGIDYLHADKASVPTNEDLGLERADLTPVSNHAGTAAVDIDGDGWTDFIGGRWQQPPALYRNRGDGTFIEEGAARGMSVIPDAAAFGAADFDNDGDADIVVAPHLGERFHFMINDGAGHFVDEAEARGTALSGTTQKHEGYSVGVVDFDLDGYLDIYISEWGPFTSEEDSLHSVLLRNRGAEAPGHFENVTVSAGLLQPKNGVEQHHGFSTGWADFDEDGWPDMALIADFNSGQFYWNNSDGTFVEGADAAGVGLDEFGMGVAIADYDNDGRLDYYATSIYSQFFIDTFGTNTGNKLYRNLGGRKFEEVSKAAGVNDTGWGWGTAFLDYDNDGDKDLIVTNGDDIGESLPEGHAHRAALSDPTTLFQNDGSGKFSDITIFSGINDTKQGKAIVVLDYDNDGDEDVIVTNTFDRPIVYRNDASTNGRAWIRLKFEGVLSNRDGIGAVVEVTAGGKMQTGLYNPSNAYIGQREPYLHFGLGTLEAPVESVVVRWPSGIRQELNEVAKNQTLEVVEPDAEVLAPIILRQPKAASLGLGERLELSVEVADAVGTAYTWEKDGQAIPGAKGAKLELKRAQPYDAGNYRVRVVNPNGETLSDEVTVEYSLDFDRMSVARCWNEFLLEAIRKDFPAPTIHGRNLYHLSATMWDVYWAYEPNGWERAQPVFHQEDLSESDWFGDRVGSQREAISYACYRVLEQRYKNSVSSVRIRYNIDWLMEQLGYDASVVTAEGNLPSAVGNRIAGAILELALDDGSNEANGYVDTSGYGAVNDPLVFKLPGAQMNDLNRWQPLAFDYQVTQNGIPVGESVQGFVGVNWRDVDTFAIEKDSGITIAWDPGPPPLFGTETHEAFVDSAVEVIRYSSLLDPESSEMIDVSPGGLLNNPLGTNDGQGRSVNPITGEPYQPNLVKHADYGRILAEFWADGPASETPPGHWNTLLNEVSEHPLFERKYMGLGEEMDELEWNVQSYLALNGAMHDAAVAAWTLKRQYDYSRPISMIRCLGGFGQSSDPDGPSYHPNGLPLIEDLIEVVTVESSAPGQRHEHLAAEVGNVAIRSWAGEPADSHTQVGGVDWILAEEWMPYQRSAFVTPAFAAYVSGHSTFSRAGAEVMSLLTGSPFFPGGMAQYAFPKGEFLEFEVGPSEDVTLQWATYFDAADQAGLSRLYGGIHVRADDFIGRTLGARIGVEAFLKAHSLRGGNALVGSSLDGARFDYRISKEARPDWLKLDFSNGRGVPISQVSSMEALDGKSEDGVYMRLGDSGQSGDVLEVRVLVKSAAVETARLSSPAAAGQPVSIDFTVKADRALIALRAWRGIAVPALDDGEGEAIPALKLYRLDGDEIIVAQSDGRDMGSNDSIVEVLALRRGFSEIDAKVFDSAMANALEAGTYRLEVSPSAGGGRLTIEIEDVR